ncbi:cytochrome-c peroxidase [Haloferula sargassicola]|uniref:Cytochrome c551 peroxidase n=1 Tax=Haloferula sargassicola TaxID=490096 RepID=A0ABP9UJ02_9BACT
METRFILLVWVVPGVAATLVSARADDARILQTARAVFGRVPAQAEEIPNNPTSKDKVALGKMLFFDPRLSKGGTLSCNSCHNLAMGGDDNLPTSVGHGWQKGPRNAPTVLNAVFNVAQFWDGRAEDLKTQAKGPVQAGVEMASTPERVESVLKSIPEYAERFGRAFPGEDSPVTFDNMARAIESFEATLITPDAPFDRYLGGDEAALDANQKAGLRLFVTKGCIACHSGVNIGGRSYHPFGVLKKPTADILPAGDTGRFALTNTEADHYVFRAAPLRNVALTAPYFHSGQIWTLEEAVKIMSDSQLGGVLDENEVAQVAAFLRSLTGKLPEVTLPELPAETAETPRPQP